MTWLNQFDDRLAALDAQTLRRRRREVVPERGARLSVDGESLLAFCSNDYLGLAQDPLLREAVHAAVERYGVGSGASPMVSGHSAANAALERELAEAVGLPRALYFYAGYATNASAVPALVGEGDALFSDALNHACLIDGARLSKATVHRYRHADLQQLDALMTASAAPRKLVISDAVFSMDGDVVDLTALHALCEKHDALLLLDDAHGFGVLGPQGRGALAAVGLTGARASPRVLYMATLGKALGVAGAFVAGPERLVEWLLQKTRSYTYATAAPALLAEAVRAGLRCVLGADGERRREHLRARIDQLREGLAPGADAAIDAAGWSLMPSTTAIQPLVIGDNAAALAVMAELREHGLWVPAIRPPTVPAGTARLRIALSAAHQADDIDALLRALRTAARHCAGASQTLAEV
ncbi:8-amino-7-oxononanoate synthase [Hydrogenophaga sp.]|uniref:aminotransferase class I/II-fold pyridoxal phosphate-dependent enzyme n=1 Tax=Hydrogenophaga sp. TaxID=1904254 RepID=UPI0027170F8F|nr:8-amino-7-oxononanoate synthase [Hydrogenophaga sp.]MDO9436595.1 8-amino-7-oxononanoate synthase [Hydrogenophaga sp.]